jgi:hypothetical protein
MVTAGAGGWAATAFTLAAAAVAVASTADVLLVVRRGAVLAMHHRGSTGVVMRFALAL